jgi:hypothetical protein
MNKSARLLNAIVTFAVCISATGIVYAQNASAQGVPVRMLVTVEAHHGKTVPEVGRADVMVYEGHDRDQVTEWVPAQADHAGLELFILLDDGSGFSLGTQLEPLRKFISDQPAAAKIGIAYMQNGIAKIEQAPTTDHALAAKALRLPMAMAGVNASPYFALSDLIKKWPESPDRREILMATNGVDPYYGTGDPQDPYLDAAIHDAERTGIVVYAIYTSGAGRVGRSRRQNYWGQTYLSRLGDESGGEAYYIGFTGSPVSFDPFLEQTAQHLDHQYWLTFMAKPPKKSGWQRVKVTTEVSNAQLVAAHEAYVSADQH